jgi:hypothetical protein
VSGLLTAYAPTDPTNGGTHPLIHPLAALVGGIMIGSVFVAVLPATPAGDDPWPVAAFAAGMTAGLPLVPRFLPDSADLRGLGWADVIAVVLAAAAAVATRATEPDEAPRVGTVTRVALLGAVVAAAFHLGYVARATESSPSVLIVVVLLLTALAWFLVSRALVRWSGTVAGPDAARFALTCAGAVATLLATSGRNHAVVWHGWLPLLGVAGAGAGVWLTRHRPAIPWDAAGIAVAALFALVVTTVPSDSSAGLILALPFAAFAIGAALGRTAVAGVVCGLVTVLLTVPILFAGATQLNRLLFQDGGLDAGTLRLVVAFSPVWLTGLLTAAFLARRRLPEPRPARPSLAVR